MPMSQKFPAQVLLKQGTKNDGTLGQPTFDDIPDVERPSAVSC